MLHVGLALALAGLRAGTEVVVARPAPPAIPVPRTDTFTAKRKAKAAARRKGWHH